MQTALSLDPANLLPPFEGSLPTDLRQSGEHLLCEVHRLTRETYSTGRLLSDSRGDNPAVLEVVSVARGDFLLCEARSAALIRYSAANGLNLASDEDVHRAVGLIEAALLKVIKPHPFLWSAVSELVWRCHILLASDDEYDVSFSDPAIPFSVFVSVPLRNDRSSILRVAENLIHETMHLQLTLFEGLCPLVDTTSTWCLYSPWKQHERPAQGLLHGVYVFHVLRWMWLRVSRTTGNRTDMDFALRRISEIDEEASAVRSLEESPALTEAGRHFLNKLFVAEGQARR